MPSLFTGLLATLLIVSLGRGREHTVVSEGRSSIKNLDLENARDRALDDAFRKAVEQGVGICIVSESLTQNYRLIYDNILSRAFGYIQEYKILDEYKSEDFYIVQIEAVVGMDTIKDDLQAIGLLMERKNMPRLMVLVQEKLFGGEKGNDMFGSQSQTEVSLVSAFLDKGFHVVDSKTITESRIREEAVKAIQGNERAAALIGRTMNADIVVAGEAFSRSRGRIRNSQLISVGTTLSLKVVRTDTGEILAVKAWNSPGAGPDELAASHNSIKRVSQKVSEELISDILDKWVAETGSTQDIQILVYEITSLSDLEFLEKTLLDQISGIQSLYRRSFERGIAVLDAGIKGEAKTVASAIQKKVFQRFKVVVTGYSKNMIKLTIVKRPELSWNLRSDLIRYNGESLLLNLPTVF